MADRTEQHCFKVWIKDDRVDGRVIAIVSAKDKERPLLNLAGISAPRLASVLTRLSRVTHGPLHLLIKEVRQKHSGGRSARRAKSVEFAKQALCVIALSLELGGEEQSEILGPKNRWTAKVRLARDKFPEVISQLQNHYEELKTGHIHWARRVRDER